MKKIYIPLSLVIIFAILFFALKPSNQDSQKTLQAEVENAICSSSRPEALRLLFQQAGKQYHDDLAFLIVNMPAADRDTMSLSLLMENIEYAHIAKDKYSWSQTLPNDIYSTYVLPYCVVDEVRDSWRKELYELFSPVVDTCKTMEEAVLAVGRCIPSMTGVEYNTLREKTNQSPRESMRQGMASCTGLSILLIDAYRSIGIPARFVGTASWHDNRGNHSWTEVWLDGEWRVTEYYLPSQLDHLWFMPDAGKATPDNRRYAIYATRFGSSEDWFPMVWCGEDSTAIEDLPQSVGAENVTQHYIDLANAQDENRIKAGTHTYLRIVGCNKQGDTSHSSNRLAMGVDIFRENEQMGGGLTAGPTRDLNDVFSVLLPKNTSYELRYYNAEGKLIKQHVLLEEEPQTVYIYSSTDNK